MTEDGDYQITVLVKDIHGNYNLYTLPLEVYTPDTEAPVLTASDLTVTIGETPDYLTGISASDNVDNDLTDQVQVDASQVLTSKEGIYPVIYTVSDKAGNIGTMECKVTVQAPKKSSSFVANQENAKPADTPAAETAPEPAAGFDNAKADELLSLVNAEREARGIGTVATKDSLTEKAKERAQSGNYSGSGVISCYGKCSSR